MHTKVLVWGTGNDFYDVYNQIKLCEEVGYIDVVTYVSRDMSFKGGIS